MLSSTLLAILLLAASPSTALGAGASAPRRPQPRSYDTHAYYTLELPVSSTLEHAHSVAEQLGVEVVEPLGELEGHWVVRTPGTTHDHALYHRDLLHQQDPVLRRWNLISSSRAARSLTPHTLKQRAKRAPFTRLSGLDDRLSARDDTEFLFAQNDIGIVDPMLNQQWHLINQELKDVELNVTGLWSQGVTGTGTRVAIIDDGLDMESDDLAENFFAEGSYDFNDHTDLPKPRLSDDQHGTRCAGEIAAVPNDVCGVGVAYNSKVAGIRILSAPISDADEAAALNYAYQLNDIYSCSWGPPDDGKSMDAPEGLILKAMVNGVQKGRDGKGSIFVFAAGNGGGVDDQCNFDGYTNSIFSITVGAIDRKGLHPYYSELCSAMMMVAPSSGSGDHIHTTDVGKDKCAHTHGGTSAAAPLAVGVFALALGVRPELTWRDMQHISVLSSVHFNEADPDWSETATKRKYSYKYGYGRVDAWQFVELAITWTLVKPQAWYDSPAVILPTDEAPASQAASAGNERQEGQEGQDDGVPNDEGQQPAGPGVPSTGTYITSDGVTSTYEVTQAMLDDSNFERLEHITARVWIDHQRRGDVEVELTSPNGITSVLARARRFDDATTGFRGWKFMSVKHWDENPVGTWTIKVKDAVNPDKIGRFMAWSLQLWGEVVDPALARDWAPAEYGEPDEEQTGSDPSTVISQKPKPTDHLPEDHASATGESHLPGLATTTAADTAPAQTTGTAPSEELGEPGFLGGVGDLATNSTWLAGAGGIILLAGLGAGLFFFIRSRSKRNSRNLFGLANDGQGGARGDYAPVSEDVPMGLLARGRRKFGRGGAGGAGGGAGAAGTKELYDAFGDGPSDESDQDDDDTRRLNESTALRYHDDFLEDEADAEGDDTRRSQAGHSQSRNQYVDDDDDDQPAREEEVTSGPGAAAVGSNSGSSGSWQDAAEDVRS